MYAGLLQLFQVLTPSERRHFLLLQGLVVLMAVLEVVGVMAIGPFMALVADTSAIATTPQLQWLYEHTHASSTHQFLFYLSLLVIGLITLASLVSVVTVWRLCRFGAGVGLNLGSRLFAHYLQQPWLFHASGNSSSHINKVVNEASRVASGIINPFLQLNAKLVLALVLSLSVFWYDPVVALVGVSFFASAYLLMFYLIKTRLSGYSEVISEASGQRMKLLNEAFGGIKEVLLKNKQAVFSTRFTEQSDRLAASLSSTQILGQIPRYMMEFIALATVIILIQVLLLRESNDLTQVLPTLAIYAMAGLKLLPAFQQVYTSSSYIRGNLSALAALHRDLAATLQALPSSSNPESDAFIGCQQQLQVVVPEYTYPKQLQPALTGIELTINAQQMIGIAGASGSGKSTLADIILGLISPDNGRLVVDGQLLDASKRVAWRRSIAYVPQDIFLMDTSIAENVAFGIAPAAIDVARVNKALAQACLTDYVQGLAHGIETQVGERGVQMSGGQRQRLGIARALYHDFDVIVMDEATSALDGPTEAALVATLNQLKGNKTVLMIAHRLSTLEACDEVLYMADSTITARGTLAQLRQQHPAFFNSMQARNSS